jgi:hypothetical protein
VLVRLSSLCSFDKDDAGEVVASLATVGLDNGHDPGVGIFPQYSVVKQDLKPV